MSVTPLPTDPGILAAAALAGSDRALGHLLDLHRPAAYHVAHRLLGREADAHDAVQEGFLLAVRAIRSGNAPPREADRFRAWLLRVVGNAALGRLRRRTPVPRVPLDTVDHALSAPESCGPTGAAEEREVRANVLQALATLPRTQQEALILREFYGLSYAEVADTLGITHGAAQSLLHRAREAFRAAYPGSAMTARVGCSDGAPLLSAMLDEELSLAAWRRLAEHLEECPHCRGELQEQRRMRHLRARIPV